MTEGGDGVKEAKGVMRNDRGGDGVQEAKGKMRRFVGESFRTFKEEEESNCYSWPLNMSGKKKKKKVCLITKMPLANLCKKL